MATPTLKFNSSTGTDTLASGSANPTTAITGTKASSRVATTAVQIGFFEADPDLSGVDTTGLSVLWIDTASGRQYSLITAVKNTATFSDTGAITSGTNTLTVLSGTGIANGDLISVVGAGAAGADLYTTVTSGGGTISIVVADNAGTTVAANVVTRPKQVTVATTYTVAQVSQVWAIGGKRATIDHADSRTLFADVAAGWIVEIEDNQAVTASAITCSPNGSNTIGRIVVRGASNSPRPILTQSANAAVFSVSGGGWEFQKLHLKNSNGTKTAAYGINLSANDITRSYVVDDCILGDGTSTLLHGVRNSGGSSQLIVKNTEVKNCTNAGIQEDNSSAKLRVLGCYVHNCTIGIAGGAIDVFIMDNIIASNSGDGINLTGGNSSVQIVGNTIYSNGGDGIDISNNSGVSIQLIIINNNISSNTGVGIRGHADTDFRKLLCDYNNLYSNSGGASANYTLGANDIQVDPTYTNAAGFDFSVGTNLKAKGFPGVTAIGGGTSATTSYVDIGAAERQEGAGSATYIFPVFD